MANRGAGRTPGRGTGGGPRPASGPGSGQRSGGPGSGQPRPQGSGRSGGRRAGAPASRGAGRTGAVRGSAAADRSSKASKTLGGEQVEGRQAVRELLLAGRRKVYEVWVANDLDEQGAVGDIIELAHDLRVPVLEVARKRLEAAARSEAPQGVLAKAAPLVEHDVDELLRRRGRPSFLVAVDGVTEPGNLGALLRVCDGAGVDGVVLPRHRAVHVTPTVAKTAAGAVEHVPIALVSGLPTAISRMRDAGIWVVGLADAADRSLFELGDLADEAICLVLGAEGAGLSRLVRERCDLLVHIPMRGHLSSLNVAAAAAIATYEVARRRP